MSESAIFKAAVKLAPERRAAYLDQTCGADPGLRREVESLLRAHDAPGSFLQDPPARPQVTVEDPPITEGPGTLIGPYKLLQQIGEGGMGVVYMAEQQEPVRRKVALKIIKPGLDSRQVIARFEAERQALAMMDHQNIAKVLDAGTTGDDRSGIRQTSGQTSDTASAGTLASSATGRPYFVMELVLGISFTKYCDDNKLTPRQRLELFIPVCHAVQHAHQKGIIHRDLKPSNILVTMYDDKPVPKVIDFGVAKAVEQRLTEKTLFTQFGTLVGTFEYMSPEQAEMNAFGVDTRSDIYSLGVLLYELLTGSTPLERQRLREAAYGEIVRLIKEEEPPRPSTRLSSSGAALAGISQQRGSEPEKLTKLVRGELDWIVMRCLDKDRTRRYETANGLARDVERYLHDEPVEACPPTAGYKLRKFARKYQKLLATAAAFAGLLLLGVAASSWQAVRATQAEVAAVANEQQAKEHATQAQKERDEVRALNEKLRLTTYAAQINLAQHAWEVGGVVRMVELLEQHRPKTGQTELRGFEWDYLYRLCHAELLTLKGHTGIVNSVAYSPDGKRLASSSGDNTTKVWDAQTGQELLTLKGGSGSVAFSPDGKRLASPSWDPTTKEGAVKVFDAQTGQELLSLKVRGSGVTFSPDGKRLASGTGTWDDTKNAYVAGEVKVWDAQTGQELLTIQGHTSLVFSVAFSPDGKRLASSSGDNTTKVWDAQTRQELLSLKGGFGVVAFSPDGKRLACGGSEVKVFDAQTGQELLTIKDAGGGRGVAFSPDGKRLASIAQGNVKLWDAQTGQEIHTIKHTGGARGVAFSPDGKRLASAGFWDFTVKVWDAQKDQEKLTLQAAGQGCVAFSPDSRRLATGSDDNTVKVWDAATGQQTLTLKGHTVIVLSVAFSPDGKLLASGGGGTPGVGWSITGKNPAEAKVWDAQTGRHLLDLQVSSGIVVDLAFSPDGKRLAGGSGNEVKVWDAQTGQELLTLKGGSGKKGGSGSVAFSPDGKRLASPSWDPTTKEGAVKVFDAHTGQELLSLTLKGHKPLWTGNVTFSPDGKLLACGSWEGMLRIWDAQTGREIRTLRGHSANIFGVAFSPDGQRLASTSGDKTVKLWDAQTGQEMLTFGVRANGPFNRVAFSPDGHRMAAGGPNGAVTIWDATPLPAKL